jgi:hypothetical protein
MKFFSISILLIILISCSETPQLSDIEEVTDPVFNESISTKEENIVQSSEKMGISLSLPPYWKIEGKEIDVIDLSGNLASSELSYIDSTKNQSLNVKFFPDPNGKILFEAEEKQFKNNEGWYKNFKEELNIDNNLALEGETILTTNGKGGLLTFPEKLIIVSIYNSNRKGLFQILFKTTQIDAKSTEISDFEQIINSFNFDF